MAPLKKKRLWNFSVDVFSGPEPSAARKKRRVVHNAVRNLVMERRERLNRRVEREVRDNLKSRIYTSLVSKNLFALKRLFTIGGYSIFHGY